MIKLQKKTRWPILGSFRVWIAIVVLVMVADHFSPVDWSVCAAHLVVLPLAWRMLHRRFVTRLTIVQVVAVTLPAVARLVRGAIENNPDVAPIQPIRIWVLLSLIAAGYFHVYLQNRLRQRLSHQRSLQNGVRQRSIQIHKVNSALRDEVARREATEHRLDQSETTFQSIIQRMKLQVVRKNVDGVFTFANDSFCEGLGRATVDVVGSRDEDLYGPAIAARYRADDLQVMLTGQPVEREEEHPGADGRPGFAHVIKAPEYDPAGNCIGIQAIFWDITDRHQHQIEMRNSEARKRALFDATGDAVILIDDQARIMEVNPSAKKLLRAGGGRLVGRPLVDLVSPVNAEPSSLVPANASSSADRSPDAGDSPQFGESARDVDAAGQPEWIKLALTRRHHLTLRRADGGCFDSEVSLHLIPMAGFVGRAVVIRDVTTQSEMIEAMRSARVVAEQANAAKTQFMAGISHELRTPLGGIQGLTELLSRQPLPATAKRYVHLIADSTQLLGDTIEDILDFAAIEAARVGINPVPVDLHEVFGDAFGCLAVRVSGSPVRLGLSIDPATPRRVVADAKRLRQIVVNLAGNAIKFTSRGEILVRLEPAAPMSHDAHGRLGFVITVRDTGIGIAPENLVRIFDAFEQADRGTNKLFGGTGLGLAIARGLAERMNGTLTVQSEVGRGSTFRCEIELEVADPRSAPVDQPPAVPRDRKTPPARVIISVGNDAIHDTLAETLLSENMTVHSVGWLKAPSASLPPGESPTIPGESPAIPGGSPTIPGRSPTPADAPFHWILTDATADAAWRLRARKTGDRVLWITKPGDPQPRRARRDDVILIEPVLPDELRRWIRHQPVVQSQRGNLSALDGDSSAAADSASRPRGHRWRLLVVDDSATNRLVIHDQLVAAGHTVETVDGGKAAIRRIKRERYDCVLMDLQMPDMDGTEATREIHAWYAANRPLVSPPPIVALTAHITDQHRKMCQDAGMAGYVTKPVNMTLLLSEIRRLLAPRGVESQAASVAVPSVVAVEDADARQEQTPAPEPPTPLPESVPAEPLADWQSRLAMHCGHDPVTMRSVADSILMEVPDLIRKMRSAAKRGDTRPLRASAHTLKSCLRYIADPGDVELAAQMELFATDDAWVDRLRETWTDIDGAPRQSGQALLERLEQASHRWLQTLRDAKAQTAAGENMTARRNP